MLSFAAPDGFHHVKPKPTMKDGISKVKSEIKGVMGIMQGNISKVLDRGAKLEDLQDKSGTVQYVAWCRQYAHLHVILLCALMVFTLLMFFFGCYMYIPISRQFKTQAAVPCTWTSLWKMLSDICRAVLSDGYTLFLEWNFRYMYLSDRQQGCQFNLFSQMVKPHEKNHPLLSGAGSLNWNPWVAAELSNWEKGLKIWVCTLNKIT